MLELLGTTLRDGTFDRREETAIAKAVQVIATRAAKVVPPKRSSLSSPIEPFVGWMRTQCRWRSHGGGGADAFGRGAMNLRCNAALLSVLA
jgi:hypothetical protein